MLHTPWIVAEYHHPLFGLVHYAAMDSAWLGVMPGPIAHMDGPAGIMVRIVLVGTRDQCAAHEATYTLSRMTGRITCSNGTTWDTAADAARGLGITPQAVSRCLKHGMASTRLASGMMVSFGREYEDRRAHAAQEHAA